MYEYSSSSLCLCKRILAWPAESLYFPHPLTRPASLNGDYFRYDREKKEEYREFTGLELAAEFFRQEKDKRIKSSYTTGTIQMRGKKVNI